MNYNEQQAKAIAIAESIVLTGTTDASLDEVLEATKFVASEYIKSFELAQRAVNEQNHAMIMVLQIVQGSITNAGRALETYLMQMGMDTDTLLFEEHNAMMEAIREWDEFETHYRTSHGLPTREEEDLSITAEAQMSDDEFLRSIGIDPSSEYYDDDPYSEDDDYSF